MIVLDDSASYTIGHTAVTDDVVPVEIFLLDITSSGTTDCMIEYQIPASVEPVIHQNTIGLGRELKVTS